MEDAQNIPHTAVHKKTAVFLFERKFPRITYMPWQKSIRNTASENTFKKIFKFVRLSVLII